MAEKPFIQNHYGYWREAKKSALPKASGVFCVYEGTPNVAKKTVNVHKLIYIGESENVNNRIANHEMTEAWSKHIRPGKVMCFGFAPIEGNDRLRVEAAYIFQHKPVENTEYVNSFPFPKTIINTKGKNKLLETTFTVGK